MRLVWGLLIAVTLGPVGAQSLCAQPETESRGAILSGTVTDSETGERLSGANVYVPALQKGATTNNAGVYRLSLPADSVTLRVSHLGYETRILRLHLTNDRTQDIALVPSPFELEELEIVGEENNLVESTQMSATTLPIAEIERLPAFLGEVDVLKTIQLLPGVQSGTEGSTGLYVRGGGPSQNLILLDGAPIYDPSHIFGFMSVFNPDMVKDVRLIKGGFPARYGGRLSSVVDVTMEDGSHQQYETEGSLGLVFSSITAEGPILEDKASFIVSARRTYIDVLARPFLNQSLSQGQSLTSYFYDANAKLTYSPSPRDKLSLSTYLGRDVYGSSVENVDRAQTPTFRQRTTSETDWGNLVATLRWNHVFSGALSAETTLLHTQYDFNVLTRLKQIEETDPPTTQSQEAVYRSGISDLGAQVDFDYQPSSEHHVRFGGKVTRHAFNPGVSTLQVQASDAGVLDTTLTPNSFGFTGTEGYLYAEDDVEVTDRLKANLGVHASAMRVEGRTYSSVQPRLSARYLLRPNWSVKGSFGTMKQYLHLLTNTGINLPTDLWLAATDEVGPQRAWQVALGSTYSFGNYVLSLEGYYKDMRGLLEYEPGANYLAPNENWETKVKAGRGWSYGAELFFRKKEGRTTGWIGYTLSWTRRTFDALNGGNAFPYRYDRRHDLSVVLSHRLSETLDVGATWVYGTGQAVTLSSGRFFDGRLLDPGVVAGGQSLPQLRTYSSRGGYRMPPYHRLDLALNWHFEEAFFFDAGTSTLSIGGYNVYNRKNPFYLFTTRGQDGARQFKQASLFPVLPYISYRFQF